MERKDTELKIEDLELLAFSDYQQVVMSEAQDDSEVLAVVGKSRALGCDLRKGHSGPDRGVELAPRPPQPKFLFPLGTLFFLSLPTLHDFFFF